MTLHAKPPAPPEDLPEWRLDDLYSGRSDPRIQADLDLAAEANSQLAALKGVLVKARSDPRRN